MDIFRRICGLHCGLISSGLFVLLIGLFSAFFAPTIIQNIVTKEVFLAQNPDGSFSKVLDRIRLPPYRITMQVWSFSFNDSAGRTADKMPNRPKLIEKGPYTFTIKMRKDFDFRKNGTVFFYKQNRVYIFNETLSCKDCKLDDRVVVPNLVYQNLVDVAKKGWEYRSLVNLAFKYVKEGMFIEVSIGDLLFNGYEDPLINLICSNKILTLICEALNIPKRIGLFYGQNNTDDGAYEIDAGILNNKNIGQVYSWNGMVGKLNTSFWYGDQARMINGTNAELFSPGLSSSSELEYFVGQMCRSFKLKFAELVTSHDIRCLRYSLDTSVNAISVQKRLGFCNPSSPLYFNDSKVQEEHCAPPGVIDLSTCLPGNPRIYMTQPHFKNSPIELNRAFAGIDAPTDSDISWFDIEPITGAVVEVQQRQQLNLGMIKSNLWGSRLQRNTIFPIIWFNESAIIDSATQSQIYWAVWAVGNAFVAGLIFIVFGALLLLTSLGFFIAQRVCKNSDEFASILPEEQEPAVDDQIASL